MKILFIILLLLIGLKSYGQDIYTTYQQNRQQISNAESTALKTVFNTWATENPLTPGHAYSACDGWPGIGYKCRAHNLQCCYKGCGEAYEKEYKRTAATYQTKLDQADADYAQKNAASNKAKEAEQVKKDNAQGKDTQTSLNKIQTNAANNTTKQTRVNNQYQQQANAYIAASNNSNSDIQRATNLNAAKISATASGNKAQVAQIQQIQNQQTAQSLNDLGNQLTTIINKPKTAEEHKLTKNEIKGQIETQVIHDMEQRGYTFDSNGKVTGVPGGRQFQANVETAYIEILKSKSSPKTFTTHSITPAGEQKINDTKKWILSKLINYSGETSDSFTFTENNSDNMTTIVKYFVNQSMTDDEMLSYINFLRLDDDARSGISVNHQTIKWSAINSVGFSSPVKKDSINTYTDGTKKIWTQKYTASLKLQTQSNGVKFETHIILSSKAETVSSDTGSEMILYFNDTTEPDLGTRLVKAFNDLIAYYKKNNPKELY